MMTLESPTRPGPRAWVWIAAIAVINLALIGLTLAPAAEPPAEASSTGFPLSPVFAARADPRPATAVPVVSQPRGRLAQNPPPGAPDPMCQTNGTIWDIAARGNTLYLSLIHI